MFYFPLEVMQMRTQGLASSHSSSFGTVRNNQTRDHQGWDLYAPVGTRCYAIAAGHVEWVRNQGAYGQQLAISFNSSGSENSSEENQLIAFYAHLAPGQIQVQTGTYVKAGQFIALTGISGNASAGAPHLHFEIRKTKSQYPGRGLVNRLDPGDILGYELYNSANSQIGGLDHDKRLCVVRGAATPIRR